MIKSVLAVLFFFAFFNHTAFAQYTATFNVNGDANKFYPVVFEDKSWNDNKATILEIGRSSVHENGDWRGSVIARFSYHVTNWGNGSAFIDADLRQSSPFTGPFIAGWADASTSNNGNCIVVWLKGGGNTYHFTAPAAIIPVVYDNNSQPYQEPNGPIRSYKTTPDNYVNSYGSNSTGSAYYAGATNNYFAGNVGIGTTNPDAKLAVNGSVHAKEIKVDTNIPVPDYVFEKDYKLPDLLEIEQYVLSNKHLPEIPSAKEMEANGLKIGDVTLKLLKKVEEMTLIMIRQQKEINKLKKRIKTAGMKNIR